MGLIADKNKKGYEKEILQTIKKYNIFNIVDIFAFYKGCSRTTFYNLELDKLNNIKDAIDDNKVTTKQSLKAKWAKSSNPTLQVALFKTICTDEERKALSMQHYESKVITDQKIIFEYKESDIPFGESEDQKKDED